MRLLIYGFGPYQKFHQNITEKVLRRFPRRSGVKKIIFPVKFHRGQFIKVVKETKSDVILGLGQCNGGRRLRIETKAVNRRRDDTTTKSMPIKTGGKRTLSTNLKLDPGRETRYSKDAGDYVCNFSMYVILDYLKHRRMGVPFGFIHVPHHYDSTKAIRFLLKVVGKTMQLTQNTGLTRNQS